jgi:hypothetical protein
MEEATHLSAVNEYVTGLVETPSGEQSLLAMPNFLAPKDVMRVLVDNKQHLMTFQDGLTDGLIPTEQQAMCGDGPDKKAEEIVVNR